MFSSKIILKENIEQYTTIFINVNNYFAKFHNMPNSEGIRLPNINY